MIIVQDTKKQRYFGSAGVQPKGDVLNKRKSGRQVAKTAPVLSDFYFKLRMLAPSQKTHRNNKKYNV